MPKFTSEKEPVQKLGGGVELHVKYMLRDGELVEVRRSFRGEGGTSVSHTNVRQDWIQPVHRHLRTVEATMVLAGRVLSLVFNESDRPKVLVYKAGSVISDEVGVFHTLYVTAGTQLSTTKVQTGQVDEKPDWHGDPEIDAVLEAWGIKHIFFLGRVDLKEFHS